MTEFPHVEGLTVVRLIGRGGQGSVYEAQQARVRGRSVALKVLATVDTVGFAREVEALDRLSTVDGAIPILDAGTTREGHPYLVTPLLPGPSLRQLVERGERTRPDELARWGARLAGALAAAHESGIVHGDVKPGNVLLNSRREPVLIDFGIAQLLAGEAATVTLDAASGTPEYLPPEVWSGVRVGAVPVSPSGDVYSLALTLMAAARGESPFAGVPPPLLEQAVSRGDLPDLSILGAESPLPSILRAAAAPDRAPRPSAHQLARQLLTAEAQRPRRHSPRLVAMSAGAIVAGLFIAIAIILAISGRDTGSDAASSTTPPTSPSTAGATVASAAASSTLVESTSTPDPTGPTEGHACYRVDAGATAVGPDGVTRWCVRLDTSTKLAPKGDYGWRALTVVGEPAGPYPGEACSKATATSPEGEALTCSSDRTWVPGPTSTG